MPPKITFNQLTKFARAWGAAGLDPAPCAPITDALDDLARLNGELRDLLDRQPTSRADIVDRLAAGQIDTLTAVITERELSAGGRAEDRERITGMHRSAVEAVTRRAHTLLLPVADQLVVEHLAPAHAEAVTIATKHADLVRPTPDEPAAIKAGGKTRDAWFRCHDAAARITDLKAVTSTMIQAQLLTLPRDVHTDFRFHVHPELIPAGLGRLDPAPRLVALIDSGATPGIYTRDQAVAHHAAWVDTTTAARRAAITTGDMVVTLG